MNVTPKSSAEIIPLHPKAAPDRFEIFRERWLRRIALDKELPAGALRLCIVVSTYTNRHSRDAWPGMARLARETGLSRRQIMRLTQLIERRGHWRVTRSRVGPKNIANRYHLTCTTMSPPSDIAKSPPSDIAVSPPPSDIAMSPEPLKYEPLNEPLNEPLPNGRDCIAADGNTEVRKAQAKRVAEEVRQAATLTSSDNPSSLSERNRRGGASGLFSEHWFKAGDALNPNGGRRR